nr:ABC transporter permease [Candidatus Cloacimonadota bacterium]
GAVIGEWLGGNAGLGIYLIRATKSYQTAQVFAVIAVIVLLSMLLYGIVAFLERILLAWNYRHEDEFVEPEPHLLDV